MAPGGPHGGASFFGDRVVTTHTARQSLRPVVPNRLAKSTGCHRRRAGECGSLRHDRPRFALPRLPGRLIRSRSSSPQRVAFFHDNSAAQRFDQLAGHEQADAAAMFACGKAQVKAALPQRRMDTRAVVVNADLQAAFAASGAACVVTNTWPRDATRFPEFC